MDLHVRQRAVIAVQILTVFMQILSGITGAIRGVISGPYGKNSRVSGDGMDSIEQLKKELGEQTRMAEERFNHLKFLLLWSRGDPALFPVSFRIVVSNFVSYSVFYKRTFTIPLCIPR